MHHHRVKTIAAMSFLHPKTDINMCHTYMFTIQFFGLLAKYAKWRPSWIFSIAYKKGSTQHILKKITFLCLSHHAEQHAHKKLNF